MTREPSVSLLFLRDEGLREGMELLYFAYRDFTAEADAILKSRDLAAPITARCISLRATRA